MTAIAIAILSEDEDEDFFLNNDDDYSGFFSDSSMEHVTLLVPIFDINAHEAGRRDLSDLAYLSMLSDVRKERWQHEWLEWENRLQLIFHEDTFNNEYRMSYNAFNELKEILRPILQRNTNKCRDSEPIMTEHIMAMGLRH